MAARNPGPILNPIPIGIARFKNTQQRQWVARRLFMESEVNTRVYKNVFRTLGLTGNIDVNRKIGRSNINMRCVTTSYQTMVHRSTRLARHTFYQAVQEGWLQKYGHMRYKFR
eukprot:GDKJ01005168.1.p1 GENE.GDKJ01005168.1~~GDKJ01005168.1.p1  ORF type:complete len:113 (+),score=5.43 GDKJ01005168.1:42-380(+)